MLAASFPNEFGEHRFPPFPLVQAARGVEVPEPAGVAERASPSGGEAFRDLDRAVRIVGTGDNHASARKRAHLDADEARCSRARKDVAVGIRRGDEKHPRHRRMPWPRALVLSTYPPKPLLPTQSA